MSLKALKSFVGGTGAFLFGGVLAMTFFGVTTGKVEYFYGPSDRILHIYPPPIEIRPYPPTNNT